MARESRAAAPAASPNARTSLAAPLSTAVASGSAAGCVCITCAAIWRRGARRSWSVDHAEWCNRSRSAGGMSS